MSFYSSKSRMNKPVVVSRTCQQQGHTLSPRAGFTEAAQNHAIWIAKASTSQGRLGPAVFKHMKEYSTNLSESKCLFPKQCLCNWPSSKTNLHAAQRLRTLRHASCRCNVHCRTQFYVVGCHDKASSNQSFLQMGSETM